MPVDERSYWQLIKYKVRRELRRCEAGVRTQCLILNARMPMSVRVESKNAHIFPSLPALVVFKNIDVLLTLLQERKFVGVLLRRGEKTTRGSAIAKNSHSLAFAIDAQSFSVRAAWHIERGEFSFTVDEAVHFDVSATDITEEPHDLSLAIEAEGRGVEGAWDIERGEGSIFIDKAMEHIRRVESSYNLALIVDAKGLSGGTEIARDIERGE
jgi:hypothetical protein